MAASPSSFLSLLSLLSLFSLSLSSSPTTITIPLTILNTKINSPSSILPYQRLTHLASLSQNRAHHLKTPKTHPVSNTPLSPRSYGGYSISLSFGTPPQTIPFVMDTGSDFVWFPCTHRYLCRNCTSPATNTPITFIPKQSSTSRILGCINPKCGWVQNNPDIQSRCADCLPKSKNCTQICPPYLIVYGSGSTGGITILDNLNLPGQKVPGFLVGCSLFSSRQPSGIVGFGRGPLSLPNQLGLKKFSYCLLSHKFDDKPESSSLVLYSGENSGEKTSQLSYTPLVKNPQIPYKEAFSVYYYVGLRKITVGNKKVKIPFEHLMPGADGNGGTIIDSGTTFSYLNHNVFEPVFNSIVEQVKEYKRAKDVESVTGLRPCYNISGTAKAALPEMRFHFKGGAEMVLPLANYFSFVDSEDVVCLTMVTDEAAAAPESAGGPAVILGNYQLQNFYTEFDLGNERFGFRQQLCI